MDRSFVNALSDLTNVIDMNDITGSCILTNLSSLCLNIICIITYNGHMENSVDM